MSLKSVTKKHLLAPDQKLTKKGLLKIILIEMEFLTQKERNWYTITSNDTFEMFHKPINKNLLTLTQNPRTFEMSAYLSMLLLHLRCKYARPRDLCISWILWIRWICKYHEQRWETLISQLQQRWAVGAVDGRVMGLENFKGQ